MERQTYPEIGHRHRPKMELGKYSPNVLVLVQHHSGPTLHDSESSTLLSSPTLSLVTHSRIYAGQFLSSAPFNSLSTKSSTACRSTRRTSSRSMATTLLSCSSKLRRRSTSFPVSCPLMCKIRRPGPITTRSILQVIVGLRSKFYSLPFSSQACGPRDAAGPTLRRQRLQFPAAIATNVIA